MKPLVLILLSLLLAACVSGRSDGLDTLAADYVKLQLAIGEHEDGYIDAYYGPPEWLAEAKLARRPLAELAARTAVLQTRLDSMDMLAAGTKSARRRAFLGAQLRAAATRLRMLRGEKLSFADEAEGLFGVRPELRPLSDFAPILARVGALVPGDGPLWRRVDAFQERFAIPPARLEAVMRVAIAECRRRTAAHIAMSADERFTLELVTGKSWSGYNYYKGNSVSLIQINTDLPIRIGRAVDLGCHEGYPGHHLLNLLVEQQLVRHEGWVEHSVYPLYSPQSLLAEGSANYGIELAFPGAERAAFEAAALYPLAGLPAADAQRLIDLGKAMDGLAPARFTIAADYLEGRIGSERAIELLQSYQLVSRRRAEQSLAFIEQYRSYVINYGLGLELVRARIEAEGPDPKRRWAAMEKLLSEPTLPSDLQRR